MTFLDFLQSRWTAFCAAIVMFAATTVALLAAPLSHLIQSHAARAAVSQQDSLFAFPNPELDQLVSELRSHRQSVAVKEADLDKLSQRIKAERAELNLVMTNLQRMEADFDRHIVTVQEEERSNLKKLAKVYAAMEPQSATLILSQLDDTTIVKILTQMRENETAPILQNFASAGPEEAKRAALITEQLRLALDSPSDSKSSRPSLLR